MLLLQKYLIMAFLYNNYNQKLKDKFEGRVQKISINAGFTCPNRDGVKGVGGCTFCNNQTFFPNYCMPEKSVTQQMCEGMQFFSRYEGQHYLAYFQAYTNTYASLDELKRLYEPVLEMDNVIGIVIGTRPDCVDERLLDYFAELNKHCYIMLEYGVESTNNATLVRINRGHSYDKSQWAINQTAARDINTGAHMILGLPGEGISDCLQHAQKLNELPLDMIKLHQLQIVKGTTLAKQWQSGEEDIQLFDVDEYIELCIQFLENLKPSIGIERFVSQSPKGMLLAPDWGLKNFEFVAKLQKKMVQEERFQGSKYKI